MARHKNEFSPSPLHDDADHADSVFTQSHVAIGTAPPLPPHPRRSRSLPLGKSNGELRSGLLPPSPSLLFILLFTTIHLSSPIFTLPRAASPLLSSPRPLRPSPSPPLPSCGAAAACDPRSTSQTQLSLLSDSLLARSSFPGGDDWASGGAICSVFAQPFAGDERILQVQILSADVSWIIQVPLQLDCSSLACI